MTADKSSERKLLIVLLALFAVFGVGMWGLAAHHPLVGYLGAGGFLYGLLGPMPRAFWRWIG